MPELNLHNRVFTDKEKEIIQFLINEDDKVVQSFLENKSLDMVNYFMSLVENCLFDAIDVVLEKESSTFAEANQLINNIINRL